MIDYSEIPWAMSTVEPCGLVTAKDMTPEQLARAREEVLWVAKQNGEHNKAYREYVRERMEAGRKADREDLSGIPCSHCGKSTTWDCTYGDLCYRCIRVANE